MSSKSSPTDPRSSEPSSPTTMSLWTKRQVCVCVSLVTNPGVVVCSYRGGERLFESSHGRMNSLSTLQCLPGPVNYLFHRIIYLSSTSLGSLLHSSTAEECDLNKHDKSQYPLWCSPYISDAVLAWKWAAGEPFYDSDVSLMETQSVSFGFFSYLILATSQNFF